MSKIPPPVNFTYTTNTAAHSKQVRSPNRISINPMQEALLELRNNFDALRTRGFTVEKKWPYTKVTHYVITRHGKIKIKYHGLLSMLRSITRQERKDLLLLRKELKFLASHPPLINYKNEISPYNFPRTAIQSSDDISKRLSLFRHIKLSNESISIFKKQVNDYRSAIAKKSSIKEVAGHGAMFMATPDTSFNKDALFSIKELRNYCKTHEKDSQGQFSSSDFQSLGYSLAYNMIKKMLMEKHEMDSKKIDVLINDKETPIYKTFFKNLEEMTNWIEGTEKYLPPDVQEYIDSVYQ